MPCSAEGDGSVVKPAEAAAAVHLPVFKLASFAAIVRDFALLALAHPAKGAAVLALVTLTQQRTHILPRLQAVLSHSKNADVRSVAILWGCSTASYCTRSYRVQVHAYAAGLHSIGDCSYMGHEVLHWWIPDMH